MSLHTMIDCIAIVSAALAILFAILAKLAARRATKLAAQSIALCKQLEGEAGS